MDCLLAFMKAEQLGDVGRRVGLPRAEHLHLSLRRRLAQRVDEAERGAFAPLAQIPADERTSPLPTLDQPLRGQIRQRASHGDARDAETSAERFLLGKSL